MFRVNSVNEFTFLVAVLLSAQTTDERVIVNIITPRISTSVHIPPKLCPTLSVGEIESHILKHVVYTKETKPKPLLHSPKHW